MCCLTQIAVLWNDLIPYVILLVIFNCGVNDLYININYVFMYSVCYCFVMPSDQFFSNMMVRRS